MRILRKFFGFTAISWGIAWWLAGIGAILVSLDNPAVSAGTLIGMALLAGVLGFVCFYTGRWLWKDDKHAGKPRAQAFNPASGGAPFGANRFGANRFGANRFGANRFGANRFGANRFGASNPGTTAFGSSKPGVTRFSTTFSGPNYSGSIQTSTYQTGTVHTSTYQNGAIHSSRVSDPELEKELNELFEDMNDLFDKTFNPSGFMNRGRKVLLNAPPMPGAGNASGAQAAPVTVTCPGCGAPVTVTPQSPGECEYCGGKVPYNPHG